MATPAAPGEDTSAEEKESMRLLQENVQGRLDKANEFLGNQEKGAEAASNSVQMERWDELRKALLVSRFKQQAPTDPQSRKSSR